MEINPMVELVFLGAAAISIAMAASVHNKRCLAPLPALVRKRQFRLGQRPMGAPPA
jgi:hypothetical protein